MLFCPTFASFDWLNCAFAVTPKMHDKSRNVYFIGLIFTKLTKDFKTSRFYDIKILGQRTKDQRHKTSALLGRLFISGHVRYLTEFPKGSNSELRSIKFPQGPNSRRDQIISFYPETFLRGPSDCAYSHTKSKSQDRRRTIQRTKTNWERSCL